MRVLVTTRAVVDLSIEEARALSRVLQNARPLDDPEAESLRLCLVSGLYQNLYGRDA